MCVPIQRVHRDSSGVLTHVGGSTRDGVPWGLTIAEAATLQESMTYSWFVEVPVGEMVGVMVKTSKGGTKYLTTSPDGVKPNNLDSLPDMPNPLAGVEPPFPLNIPGPITASLMRITSIGYSGNHTLTSLTTTPLTPQPTSTEFTKPASFFTQTPRWFWINAVVPFPAEIMAFENGFGLEQVAGDDPGRRFALESAGKGWWTLEYVLTRPDGTIDPTKPSRLTEVKVVIRPGTRAWGSKNVGLSLDAFSINPNCYIHPPGGNWGWCRQGSGFAFRVKQAVTTPPPPPPTVTLPSVVGVHLDVAMKTLFGLGLKNIFVIAPSIIAADQKVDGESPTAGTVVKLTDSVYLTASAIAPQTGVAKIVVSNQANRATSMNLWLYDYSTGQWDDKGTVAYQAQKDVDLADGHTYILAAVDPTMLNCHTGQPTEGPCVYQSTSGAFAGDSNGVTIPWQIL